MKVEKMAKKAIDQCKKDNRLLVTCVDGYQTDSEAKTLRDMLWYAREQGVLVHFVPKKYTTN